MKFNLVGENNYLGCLQEEFFKNRGVTDYKNFMNLDDSVLSDPWGFENMKEAVKLFEYHEKRSSNILTLVDA